MKDAAAIRVSPLDEINFDNNSRLRPSQLRHVLGADGFGESPAAFSRQIGKRTAEIGSPIRRMISARIAGLKPARTFAAKSRLRRLIVDAY
jgi:hypothetical protein